MEFDCLNLQPVFYSNFVTETSLTDPTRGKHVPDYCAGPLSISASYHGVLVNCVSEMGLRAQLCDGSYSF